MRAPVYRNLEAQSSLLGLAYPFELLAFLAGTVTSIQLLPPTVSIAGVVGLYLIIRILSHGRPPLFFQHWAARAIRTLVAGTRISAAARSRAPRYPLGQYHSRDLPPRGSRHG